MISTYTAKLIKIILWYFSEHWRNKVKEYSSWLDEDVKYGTNESKRVGKPKTAEDMFGVEGSFRQLQVD